MKITNKVANANVNIPEVWKIGAENAMPEPDRIIEVCGVRVAFYVDADENTVSPVYNNANLTAEDIEEIEARGWHEDCSPPPPPWGGEGGIPLGYPIVPAPRARCQGNFLEIFSFDFS